MNLSYAIINVSYRIIYRPKHSSFFAFKLSLCVCVSVFLVRHIRNHCDLDVGELSTLVSSVDYNLGGSRLIGNLNYSRRGMNKHLAIAVHV